MELDELSVEKVGKPSSTNEELLEEVDHVNSSQNTCIVFCGQPTAGKSEVGRC